MKSEQQVEEMKNNLAIEIEVIDKKINKASNLVELGDLSNQKIRKIAQYNILLEVLK